MAKTEHLYASSGGAQQGTDTQGNELYGRSYNRIGVKFIYSGEQVIAMNRDYYQGYFAKVDHAPWMDGVSVLSMRVLVNVGQAYNSGEGRPMSGTVSVCAAVSGYSESLGYEYLFAQMGSAQEFATCPTGQYTVVEVTGAELMESILRYGVVLKAKTSNMYADAYVSAVEYEYKDENEAPDVTLTSSPSVVYMGSDIKLSWGYSQSADLVQTAVDAELCSEDGAVSYRLADKVQTAAKTLTVNLRSIKTKITAGNKWAFRVRAYAKSNTLVSEWAQSSAVTLKNITPMLVSPKSGENRMASSAIRMQWKKSDADAAAGTPYGFTLQYSETAGESWKDLLNKESAGEDEKGWYVDVPADTFSHGTINWRVLVWDTEYQYGNFARDTFNAVVQASTSAVGCDGKPLPTVSWVSASQVAYQVKFADYDSGAVYGTANSHRIPYVYDDGLYAVQVRTQATTGAWSDWTQVQYVQIENVQPSGTATVSVEKMKHSVTVTWRTSGTFAGFILYRNGIPVYAGSEKTFADAYANGKVTYTVRAITASKYYVQSAAVSADATPESDCLYDVEAKRWIPMKFSAEPRRRQYMRNEKVTYRYYAGRKKPVAYTEGFLERSGSFVCCTKSAEDAKEIEALAGAEVICKGRDGESIRGILNGVQRISGRVQDVSFTVTEVDWEEKVRYETA